MQILFTLCLLHATNALKGPRLVTGEPGGAVTIQCRYAPLSIYRHQRKYWCRLNPLTWICHTIVSTNSYTHRQYHGRVALTDFRHSGLFVVRLSQLSSDDVGYYRCGVGNQNDILFFSMNLTISTGMGCGLVGQVGEENARILQLGRGRIGSPCLVLCVASCSCNDGGFPRNSVSQGQESLKERKARDP